MRSEMHIHGGVYQVGGPEISDPSDAAIYLVDGGRELALIDSGAGFSVGDIFANIKKLGFDPGKIATLVLTHCHIDHVGGAKEISERTGCNLVAHELDARPLEEPDPILTAADIYSITLAPMVIDHKMKSETETIPLGPLQLQLLHTPGHSPGSISVYVDIAGQRVLFGQDIHGPFAEALKSDLKLWRVSMHKLLALNADILCEGHYGVYSPADRVKKYIESFLERFPK